MMHVYVVMYDPIGSNLPVPCLWKIYKSRESAEREAERIMREAVASDAWAAPWWVVEE